MIRVGSDKSGHFVTMINNFITMINNFVTMINNFVTIINNFATMVNNVQFLAKGGSALLWKDSRRDQEGGWATKARGRKLVNLHFGRFLHASWFGNHCFFRNASSLLIRRREGGRRKIYVENRRKVKRWDILDVLVKKKRGAHCWLNRPLGYVDVMVID